MEQKQIVFQNKGMTRDLSISKVSNEQAWENFNIRITPSETGTTLSVTNEKGNVPMDLRDEEDTDSVFTIEGELVGWATLNEWLILFTIDDDSVDRIYRIQYHNNEEIEWTGKLIYSGDLNLSMKYPLETLPYYESQDIQKVYWVDGINQPRMINFMNDVLEDNNTQFDFITTFDTGITVDIEKVFLGTANFSAGVIQYFITYSKKYGQQTNIVWKSAMYYLTNETIAVSAEASASCAFQLTLSNLDTNFDYVNIYSVIRTSQSGTPTVRLVASLTISESVIYTDTGASGSDVDATSLLYVGGRQIIPYTMTHKDNVLFLGNITLDGVQLEEDLKAALDATITDGESSLVSFKYSSDYTIQLASATGLFAYDIELNESSYDVMVYKRGERYRFGLQFVTATGERTSTYWIGDKTNDIAPKMSNGEIIKASAFCIIPEEIVALMREYGYVGVTLQRAIASDSDKNIVAQGIVSPTLFNLQQRYGNAPHALSSWFVRPQNGSLPYLHYNALPTNESFAGEVQCSSKIIGQLGTNSDDEYEMVVFNFKQVDPVYSEEIFDEQIELAKVASSVVKTGKYTIWIRMYKKNRNSIRGEVWEQDMSKYSTPKLAYASSVWKSEFVGAQKNIESKITKPLLNYIKITYGTVVRAGFKSLSELTSLFKEEKSKSWHDRYGHVYDDLYGGYYTWVVPDVTIGALTNTLSNFCVYNQREFYIDSSIVTMNSPDINSDISLADSGLNFRIVGIAPLSAFHQEPYIDIESSASDYYYQSTLLESNQNVTDNPEYNPSFAWIQTTASTNLLNSFDTSYENTDEGISYTNINVSYPFDDEGLTIYVINDEKEAACTTYNTDTIISGSTGLITYPWHKTGYMKPGPPYSNDDEEYAQQLKLNSKILARWSFAYYTTYIDNKSNFWECNGTPDINLCGGDYADNAIISVNGADRTYYANYDFILKSKYYYPVCTTGAVSQESVSDANDYIEQQGASGGLAVETFSSDPINIAVRTSEHAVISFPKITYDEKPCIQTLPYFEEQGEYENVTEYNGIDVSNIALTYTGWVMKKTSSSSTTLSYFYYAVDTLPTLDPDEGEYLIEVDGFDNDLYEKLNAYYYTYFSDTIDLDYGGCIVLYYDSEYYVYSIDNIYSNSNYSYVAVSSIDVADALYSDTGWSEDYDCIASNISIVFEGYVAGIVVSCEMVDGTVNSYLVTDYSESSGYYTFNLDSITSKHFTDSSLNICVAITIGIFTTSGIETVEEAQADSSYIEGSFNLQFSNADLSYLGAEAADSSSVYGGSLEGATTYTLSVSQITTTPVELLDVTYINTSGDCYIYTVSSSEITGPSTAYYNTTFVYNDYIGELVSTDSSFCYVGEIYRNLDTSTLYGGYDENAIELNTFIDAGATFYLSDNDTTLTIEGPEGDSYFQRYDILHTIPYSTDTAKENSVIDIFSCMLESRTNLDGRYDKQRALSDNSLITIDTYNSINTAYTQEDSYLTSSVLDSKYTLESYPAQITWSLAKTLTEEVDTWCNITLASVLDLDGDKGSVKALRRYNNTIISFQDKGIAEILFNTRTQMTTTQGVPVELANSGTVDGKRYITEKSGCLNKWSIVETKAGIYYIDNINKSINVLGQNISSLSESKGFRSWITNRNSIDIWNPEDFNNFVAYWDKTNSDVYFVSDELSTIEDSSYNVLCYNELLGNFSSFFNYGRLQMLTSVQDRLVAFRNVDGTKLWLQREGNYDYIFNEYQPFHVMYRVTPEPYYDKTFTNLEWRADIFDMSQTNEYMPEVGVLTDETFDHLKVWNEYQGNEVDLDTDIVDYYADVRKRFRIWRCDIPRDKKSSDNPFGLNRIRNPWIYLKLEKTNSERVEGDNMRMEMHDLIVKFFG